MLINFDYQIIELKTQKVSYKININNKLYILKKNYVYKKKIISWVFLSKEYFLKLFLEVFQIMTKNF